MAPTRWLLAAALLLMTLPVSAVGPPPAPLRDTHGEPLPRGAVARFRGVHPRFGDNIRALAFSPDNKRLAVLAPASGAMTVHIWRLADGRVEKHFSAGCDKAESLVYSRDVRLLAVQGPAEVRLIDMGTGKVKHRLASKGPTMRSVAFSPDGKTVAVGTQAAREGEAGTIRRWELASGKELGALAVEGGQVDGLVFSGDGKRLVAGGYGHRLSFEGKWIEPPKEDRPFVVSVWEMPSGKLVKQLRPPGWVVHLSPCADRFTVREWKDQRYAIWSIRTGKRIASLPEAHDAVAFFPDGQSLLLANLVRDVLEAWNARTATASGRLAYWGTFSSIVALSPDGKLLAYPSGFSGEVRIRNLVSNLELRPGGGHTNWVRYLALSPDGRTLVSGDWSGHLLAWETHSAKELRAYLGHDKRISAVRISPDGKWVASGDENAVVQVWALDGSKRAIHAPPHSPPLPFVLIRTAVSIGSLTFTSDSKQVLDLREERHFRMDVGSVTVRLLTARPFVSGKTVRTIAHPDEKDLCLGEDGRTAVALSQDKSEFLGAFRIRRIDTGWHLSTTARRPGAKRRYFTHGAPDTPFFSPDGKRLAVGAYRTTRTGGADNPYEYEVVAWESATGSELLSSELNGRPLAFSPNGRLLAVVRAKPFAYPTNQVVLLDVETGRELRTLVGHQAPVNCAAFSPDGTRLYTGSDDRTILAWDVADVLPRDPPRTLSATDLDRHWLALASDDARAGTAAVRALAASPGQALPMLRARLRPVAVIPAATIAAHIHDLSSDSFARRRRAEAALLALGDRAELALVQARDTGPDLEASLRAARLLAQMAPGPTPDRLRALRATTALERMNTPAARQFLTTLSQGARGALLTEEAAAALRRVSRRL